MNIECKLSAVHDPSESSPILSNKSKTRKSLYSSPKKNHYSKQHKTLKCSDPYIKLSTHKDILQQYINEIITYKKTIETQAMQIVDLTQKKCRINKEIEIHKETIRNQNQKISELTQNMHQLTNEKNSLLNEIQEKESLLNEFAMNTKIIMNFDLNEK